MAKRVFSGVQPTGAIHIGNYIGAIRNWVRMQEDYECFYCIVDYHAITIPYEAKEMPTRVFEAALDILACGVDPEKSVFFVQSTVPEHTELAWIFNSVTSMGALERMTQFKEKSELFRDNINAGLFTYPVLQAADILVYLAEVVPVGEDQLQHLELTREVARRFNHRFGETFPEPEAALTKGARIMALNEPTRKMSKSIPGSFISLTETDQEMKKKIMRAVTDTGPMPDGEMSPGVQNLFTLLEAMGDADQIRYFREQYEAGTLRYGELKPAVADAVIRELGPIRDRRAELAAHPNRVWEALDYGTERARKVAAHVMRDVRSRMGMRGGRD